MEIRKDREQETVRNERLDTGVAFAAVHSKDAAQKLKSDEEKMSIFWRVFGGTFLSICALVGITIYNNLANNISELRSEISRINEAKGELIKKDEFNTRISNTYERVQNLQSQNNTLNASITSLQTAIAEIKDRLTVSKTDSEAARKDTIAATEATKKDQQTVLDVIRKEQAAVNDGLKKEIAAIEGLKERLTAAEGMKKELESIKKDLASIETVKEKLTMIAMEIKDHRDDLLKLRQDVERNQAGDTERKKSRDDQYAKLQETMKELDKSVRACSEKVARLEGVVTPSVPMKPSVPAKSNPGEE